MAKKKRKNILGNFDFNAVDPYGGKVETPQVEATKRLNIAAVMPDPQQPRRLLSDDLYGQLYTGEQSAVNILNAWLARAEAPNAAPALKESVVQLKQLAATIQHHDLINPVTVREVDEHDKAIPDGITHIIVTGERRWWSHVFLTAQELPIGDDGNPDRVKVSVVPRTNIRAIQLIENVARADLSLIEKAKGIMALRAELSQQSEKAAPWKQVEDMLGISRSYRTRILKVLALDPKAQVLVSKLDLPEKTLRPIAENLQEYPELQSKALKKIAVWQSKDEGVSHERVSQMVTDLLGKKSADKSPKPAKPAPSGKWLKTFSSRINSTLKHLYQLDNLELSAMAAEMKEGDETAVSQLAELRNKLNQLLDD